MRIWKDSHFGSWAVNMISAEQVKNLRNKTGASMMDCKKALVESKGDEDKALTFLQKKGKMTAMKKSERTAGQGIVESYIHSDKKMGVLLELKCETDFVAKNEEFKELAHELAVHVAGMNSKDVKSLLGEPFVRDPEKKIKDLIDEKVAKFGENIQLGKFVRYEL